LCFEHDFEYILVVRIAGWIDHGCSNFFFLKRQIHTLKIRASRLSTLQQVLLAERKPFFFERGKENLQLA
jgi:hypothetical protein